MAKKWQRMAILGRSRVAAVPTDACLETDPYSSLVADKGHFIVYTAEGRRFMVPLIYLNSKIFNELLKLSEEEFGLPGNGPITLPCDAVFMEYVVSLLRRRVSEDVERALLSSLLIPHHHVCSLAPVGLKKQPAICSF
ncbi:auxin-responsive protein SAUR36-like [Typha angustifolia]|uniref:auxin-responsive protein SAUR36-like n=1 Tax=Typha angustifolia TaxID=59011 RepID=UPI003C2C31E3